MNPLPKRLKSIFLALFHAAVDFYENGSLPQGPLLANSALGAALLRVWKIFQKPSELLLRYLRDTWFEDIFINFKLAASLWNRGWLGRVELMSGLLGGLAVPMVFIFSPGDTSISAPILITGLVVYALAYSLAFAAASHLAFPLFTLTGIFLTWYMFIIGGSLAGTIWFALPSLWLLICGELMAFSENSVLKYAWLGLLCVVVAYLTYGALGFRTLFKGVWEGAPIVLLSLVYFLLTALPPYLRRSKPIPVPPSSGFLFLGTLLVTGLFFFLATTRDSVKTADYVLLSARGLLGIVDFFWMWLGATLVESALDMGDWWTAESVGWVTKRFAIWMVPILWGITAVFGWICTTAYIPDNLALVTYQVGLHQWVLTWDDSLYFSIQNQVYASLAALGILLLFMALKRQSLGLIGLLNGLWIAVFIATFGFYQSYQGFATLETDAVPPSEWWLVVVLVFGLVWEMTQAGESYWASTSPGKHLGLSALLTYMLSICILTLGAGSSDLIAEYTFYSFYGIIYLGIPVMGYLLLKRIGIHTIEKSRLIGLVALGAVSATIPLGVNPWGDGSLLYPPLAWFLFLWLFGKKIARFENWFDALLAGSALAVGFVAFWMSPEAIPVPFLGFVQDYQDRYLTLDSNRPFLLEGQIWITLAALGVGCCVSGLAYGIHKYVSPHIRNLS